MDKQEEYHDPDYPEASINIKNEPPSLTEEEKLHKIKDIIRREFSNELEVRENEVMLIDQRMSASRRLLHRLRYAIVNSYYQDQKLQLSNAQIQDDISAQQETMVRAEVAAQLRDGQGRIHPSVRKLLGKKTVDIEEIFQHRAPRNKTRKNYSAMLKRNYTISADSTKSLRPEKPEEVVSEPDPSTSRPKKVPRQIDPKVLNVVTLDEITRNKMKHRYRIIIGNTSKYTPAASQLDRSTHKWLLYVRGPPAQPQLGALLSAVTVTLHHSYAPHHVVHVRKPPFHVSRRGWGEFPARVELHFARPDLNRPVCIDHTIRLDRTFTGVQVLGAETLVDVWLYSTPEMLKYEFKEETETVPQAPPELPIAIKTEPQTEMNGIDDANNHTDSQTDSWLDFFSKETELDVDEMIIRPQKKTVDAENLPTDLDVPIKTEPEELDTEIPNEILNQPTSVKKRIVKYIDPTTGKIYYLEMDRKLDLSKVQEIIINNKKAKISPIKSNGLKNVRRKKGVSLLKPEIKSLLKSENCKSDKLRQYYPHIENDHCYLATPARMLPETVVEVKKEKSLFDCLCSVMHRFSGVRPAVNYLLKRIPLISGDVRDPDFIKHFPFVVENEQKYWKLDFAKRRNIEWSRAKLINKLLTEHIHSEPIWRTKQILLYARLHGHYPFRIDQTTQAEEEWPSWNNLEDSRRPSNIKDLYPNPKDISSLSVFEQDFELSETVELSDDEEEVDILGDTRVVNVKVAQESVDLTPLPVESEEDRMRFLYIERICADLGLELRNEDVGNGYSYSAVHAVLLSAMKSFVEEIIRISHAEKLMSESNTQPPSTWVGCPRTGGRAELAHVWEALRTRELLTGRRRAAPARAPHAL